MGPLDKTREGTDGEPERGSQNLPSSDRQKVADRIRALFDVNPLSEVAGNLHVSISALEDAVHPVVPVQTVDVLAAITYAFGVDPSWLLTGVYDGRTHVASASSEEAAASVVRSILRRSL